MSGSDTAAPIGGLGADHDAQPGDVVYPDGSVRAEPGRGRLVHRGPTRDL